MFGPTWQGEMDGEGAWSSVNERPVVSLWGAGGHIGEQQVLSQSGRWPKPPEWSPRRREILWLAEDQYWQGQRSCWFAKYPVRVHLAWSHMTGDVSDRPCVWCLSLAPLKSLILAYLCCDHMGRGGPSLPLRRATGSGFVSLPVTMDVAAFQRMPFCFWTNLIFFFPQSLQGWPVSVLPLCYQNTNNTPTSANLTVTQPGVQRVCFLFLGLLSV